jgi:hypothetical protein
VLCALFMVVHVLTDLLSWCGLLFRPRKSLGAEILFLRRQLALYVERGEKLAMKAANCRIRARRRVPRQTARRGLDLLFYVNLGMQTAWASRMVRDRVFRRSSRKAGGQSPFCTGSEHRA